MDDENDYLSLGPDYEPARIGTARPWPHREPVAVYNAAKVVEILREKGIGDPDEAAEYFDFNIEGAYVGRQTPIYVWPTEAT